MVKPELHTDGSVKTNPNSLIRSSLKLSGIGALTNAHGAATLSSMPVASPAADSDARARGWHCWSAGLRYPRYAAAGIQFGDDTSMAPPAACGMCICADLRQLQRICITPIRPARPKQPILASKPTGSLQTQVPSLPTTGRAVTPWQSPSRPACASSKFSTPWC